jgi:hypothetical protein
MHWVLQDNLTYDNGLRYLSENLPRWGIPCSLHTVVPFVGEILPDISPEGNVIVIGAYSMRHVARRKGWIPGCFDIGHLSHEDFVREWGAAMLNASAFIAKFPDVPKHPLEKQFFYRPAVDSKAWSGMVTSRADFLIWHDKVMSLIDEGGSTITRDTDVVVAPIKQIAQEHRCWVVDRRVVTTSMYKLGETVLYRNELDSKMLQFAQTMADHPWQPARAYVLDVSLDYEGQCRVIEVNTLNSAGFYAADMQKLVEAIEGMEFP